MKKLLIVEDDQHKLDHIVEYVKHNFSSLEIGIAKAYQTGLKALRDWRPELVLLDMSLPTYEIVKTEKGGRPRPFAGRELLHEMQRRRILAKVIVITQFDSFGEGEERKTLQQIEKEIAGEFSGIYYGSVYYDPAESGWRDALGILLGRAGGDE